MQVNDLPTDIQNKIFYFLEHPTAAIVRGHTYNHDYHEFFRTEEARQFYIDNFHLEFQIRHKLKVKYITEQEAKKLDPLFLHMNKEMIENIIYDHFLIELDERKHSCEECYCQLKDCQCFVPRKIYSCCDGCNEPWEDCQCVCCICGDEYRYCKGSC